MTNITYCKDAVNPYLNDPQARETTQTQEKISHEGRVYDILTYELTASPMERALKMIGVLAITILTCFIALAFCSVRKLWSDAISGKKDVTVGMPESAELKNEKIEKIVNSLNVNRHINITGLDVREFIRKGGSIQVLGDDQVIPLNKNERYIIGCSSGINRSQTHRAYMIKNGIPQENIHGILAGGDSAFNPTADFPAVGTLYNDDAENQAFMEQFGMGKIDQIGVDAKGRNQYDKLKSSQEYYTSFIENLVPTHFVVYAMSGPAVLSRLLNSGKESLKDFTITFIDWPDQIAHPEGSIKSNSQEAYAAMEERLKKHFPIVD